MAMALKHVSPPPQPLHKKNYITICKQSFGANFFTRCFTLETYTFGLQNVYVWLAKHVRLADKTCTFGRQNVYVCLTKPLSYTILLEIVLHTIFWQKSVAKNMADFHAK